LVIKIKVTIKFDARYEITAPLLKRERRDLNIKNTAALRKIIDAKMYIPVRISSPSKEPAYLSIMRYTVKKADQMSRLINPARLT